MYVCIYIYNCMYVCIYIYIYIYLSVMCPPPPENHAADLQTRRPIRRFGGSEFADSLATPAPHVPIFLFHCKGKVSDFRMAGQNNCILRLQRSLLFECLNRKSKAVQQCSLWEITLLYQQAPFLQNQQTQNPISSWKCQSQFWTS